MPPLFSVCGGKQDTVTNIFNSVVPKLVALTAPPTIHVNSAVTEAFLICISVVRLETFLCNL